MTPSKRYTAPLAPPADSESAGSRAEADNAESGSGTASQPGQRKPLTLNDDRPASCPRLSQMTGLLNDLLEEDEQQQVADHVDQCAACQSLLDRLTAAQIPPENDASEQDRSTAAATHLATVLRDVKGGGLPVEPGQSQRSKNRPSLVFPAPPVEGAPLGRLGGYLMQAEIGSGAAGLLFRAIDPRLQRSVAIKILRSELAVSPAARTRFEQEARAVARLQHPHIVQIHDVGTPTGFPPYMSMELLEGGSLNELLKRAVVSVDESVRLIRQVLAGLSHAHEHRVIHRDIKPSNILLDQQQQIRLVDFGLARLDEQSEGLTAENTLAGTPAYMAPEQILNPSDASEVSDVYGAGIVLFELLTGTVPFHGVTRVLLHKVVHEDPPSPGEFNDVIPRDLQTICLKAIAREPDRRYGSAAEFDEDLQRWQRHEPVRARPVSWFEKRWRQVRRHPLLTAALTSIAVLLCGVVGIWLDFTLKAARTNSRLQAANRDLTDASVAAAQNEKAAVANAALARQQTNLAYDVLQSLIFDLQDQFEESESLASAREAVLTQAVAGLERLSLTVRNSQMPQLDLAVALNRLAETWQELDKPKLAIRDCRRAAEILSQMAPETRRSSTALQCRMWIEWNLAACLRSEPKEASKHLQTCIDSAEQLLNHRQGGQAAAIDARLHVVNAHRLLGEIGLPNDRQYAERCFRRAISAAATGREPRKLRLARADAAVALARLLCQCHRRDEESRQLLSAAAVEYDQAMMAENTPIDVRARLSVALISLAELELQAEQTAAAASHNSRVKELLLRSPHSTDQVRVMHYLVTGRIAVQQGEIRNAQQALLTAEECLRHLPVAELPHDASVLWFHVQMNLASLEEQTGDTAAARIRRHHTKEQLQSLLSSVDEHRHNALLELLSHLNNDPTPPDAPRP